ncbi:S8 family serine peptidase [Chitinophaga sp. CF418]|uniref:S8 family serine peptidase n=1 Tax=Chitinophaga sp. CF418 TaxID=1855287 RepID=UPI0009141DC3|nr:S8 family serine peptidase [Chitinophaga sp. CF418]SHN36021.1 Serine protease, subtilisin family [Chitinophaga sp. CF418]
MKCWLIVLIVVLSTSGLRAQQPGWLHLDPVKDSVFGISTAKAYMFLQGRKSTPVVIAVIDSGVDTAHADIRHVLWTNLKEKDRNKKDDDKNGYKDDIHGWGFIGSVRGNVREDNTELTRLVREGQKRFNAKAADTTGYAAYQALYKKYDAELTVARRGYKYVHDLQLIIDSMLLRIGKNNPSISDINAYEPNSPVEANVKALIRQGMKRRNSDFTSFKNDEIDKDVAYFRKQLDYTLNLEFDPRSIVGDNYADAAQHYYGITDVTGPDAKHGTHVAGIIAAERNNGIGIDGVADNVRIMVVRAVPDGDERDKDIANAIRYAVDNGAKVINMSFGKPFSYNKKIVDDAVKYAMEKDVLIIHAAGNSGLNLDINDNFPNKRYADGGGIASAWLEVGASTSAAARGLAASFSNYGKHTVDVFAPGQGIYSLVPGNQYQYLDGTSMAAPVAAGVAGLIRAYFPGLTAVQVKDILMQSATRPAVNCYIKNEQKEVSFADLSVSGGIINAAAAVKLAIGMSSAASVANGLAPVIDTTYHKPPAAILEKAAFNDEAPDFELTDTEGNKVKRSDLRGKVIVLDFWATWCLPCIRSFPAMKMTMDKYKDDPAVAFFYVHTAERSDTATAQVKTFLKKNGYPFTVLMDLKDPALGRGKVARDYGVSGLPMKVIIDPKGMIRYETTGFSSDSNEVIVNEMSAMIDDAKRR